MEYYFSKKVKGSFNEVLLKVTQELKSEGFGVLTEIDVQATLKKKLDVDFRPYKILGACNPPFAHKALIAEDKIGLMLPCNIVVQQLSENESEVSAIDPVRAMSAVQNEALGPIAEEVSVKLKKVIEKV